MHFRKHFFTFSLLFIPFFLQAQFLGPKDPDKGRQWNIRFTLDGAAIPIDLQHSESYSGEYYAPKYDPDSVLYYEWEWAEWDTTHALNPVDNLQRHFRFGVEVNVWKKLYAGVNYSGFFVRQFFSSNNRRYDRTIPFGTLEGKLTYAITFKKLPRFTIQPSVFAGTYTGDYYDGYEGIGREISVGAKLALGLILSKKHGHMFRIWAGRQDLFYQESENSFVYEGRTREYQSHWTFVNAGFGLMWNIRFREDK